MNASEVTLPPANTVAEPMTPVDRAWLEMDEPRNPMVVASISEFDGVDDVQQLAHAFVERLLQVPRFRQRVVPHGDGYAWVEDDDLHLGYHVHIRRLEDGTSDAALSAAVATELTYGLDHALPLWRINLFDQGGGHVTLLFRAHHAIADGVALMKLLLQLPHANGRAHTLPAHDERHHGPLGGVIHNLETVNTALENLTAFVLDDLHHPGQFSRQLCELQRTLTAVARVVTLPDDNPPRFRAAPCGRRAVAWTGNISFGAVRAFAKAQGITINDVFLTALTGAFGRYLRETEGTLAEQQNLRVSVPVNLRTAEHDGLGNHFGLVLVDLPVGLEGWHARLDVVTDRMQALKHSPEASATLLALGVAGRLPLAAEKSLVNLVGNKAVAVVSNLPGPRHALTFAGARLSNIVFWPPQTAQVGIGVSFLSYAGHITVGISADTAQLAYPQRVIDAFCAELEAMLGRSPLVRGGPTPARKSRPTTARSPKGVNHATH